MPGNAKLGVIRMLKFYKHMLDECNFKPHSLESIHSILHPVFTRAVRDDIIRKNPTDGLIKEIKQSRHWQNPKRHALTIEEQTKVLNFVSNSNMYKCWSLLSISVSCLLAFA